MAGAGGGVEWSALTSPSPQTRFHLIALRHCPFTHRKHMSSLVSTKNVPVVTPATFTVVTICSRIYLGCSMSYTGLLIL